MLHSQYNSGPQVVTMQFYKEIKKYKGVKYKEDIFYNI